MIHLLLLFGVFKIQIDVPWWGIFASKSDGSLVGLCGEFIFVVNTFSAFPLNYSFVCTVLYMPR